MFAAIRAAGHSHARLWVLHNNDRARRFYDRFGAPTGKTEDVVLAGLPLHHLEYAFAL